MLHTSPLGAEPGFQYRPSDWKVATAVAPLRLVPLPGFGAGGVPLPVLLIVTLRWVVAMRPALSVACAISAYEPFVYLVVSKLPEYGEAVVEPTSVLVLPWTRKKSTLATATLSVALAE